MKRKSILCCSFVLLFGLLTAAVAWAQAQQQPSLADIAKQKPAAKAKKVVTNDEIPPSPEANNAPAVASPASAGAASAGSAPSGAAPDAEKEGGKATPASEKQTKLQELMKEHDSLEKIAARLQQEVDSTSDENVVSTLAGMLEHAKEQLAQTQQEIDKLKASGAAAGKSPAAPTQAPPPPK